MKVRVDAQKEEVWDSDSTEKGHNRSIPQNVFPDETFFIGTDDATNDSDFRLDEDPDGVLRSREEMGVVEIDLDQTGYSLAFIIEQSGVGEDLVIQGVEIEFTHDGYETEHEVNY